MKKLKPETDDIDKIWKNICEKGGDIMIRLLGPPGSPTTFYQVQDSTLYANGYIPLGYVSKNGVIEPYNDAGARRSAFPELSELTRALKNPSGYEIFYNVEERFR